MRAVCVMAACVAIVLAGVRISGLLGRPRPATIEMRDGGLVECADLYGYRTWTCTLPGGAVIEIPGSSVRVIRWDR